jgi:hypothetical protein
MAAHMERPIIFALSNPRAQSEAYPVDLIAWTDGRAPIATGSAFPPVTFRGVTYVVAQRNSATLCAGLSLGAIVSRVGSISDGMFAEVESAMSSTAARRVAATAYRRLAQWACDSSERFYFARRSILLCCWHPKKLSAFRSIATGNRAPNGSFAFWRRNREHPIDLGLRADGCKGIAS